MLVPTTHASLSPFQPATLQHAWNVLFPDDNSIYHVTLAHIKRGDAFKISSDELPYARYFSFQVRRSSRTRPCTPAPALCPGWYAPCARRCCRHRRLVARCILALKH